MRAFTLLLLLGACGGAHTAAPPPAAAPAQSGTASPEEYTAVQTFFAKKRAQVFTCYANAIENRELSDKASGRVKVALSVLPSGTAANVRVAETTLSSKPVEDCIAGMVSRWQLPAPSQRIEFVYTYELKPE
jgi:hypothetical protein